MSVLSAGSGREARRGRRRPGWKAIVLGLLGAYAVLLIVLNANRIKVDFVFFDARTRVFVLVLLAFALGVVVGWLVPRFRARRRSHG
jgi:uncharacterized integral membrane protein